MFKVQSFSRQLQRLSAEWKMRVPQCECKRNQRIPLLNRPWQRIRYLIPNALQSGKHTVPPSALIDALDGCIDRNDAGQRRRKRRIQKRDTIFFEHTSAGIDNLAVFELTVAVWLVEPLERNLACLILRRNGEHGHALFAKEARLSADTNLNRCALPVDQLRNGYGLGVIQIVSRQPIEQITYTKYAELFKQLRALWPDSLYACQG